MRNFEATTTFGVQLFCAGASFGAGIAYTIMGNTGGIISLLVSVYLVFLAVLTARAIGKTATERRSGKEAE